MGFMLQDKTVNRFAQRLCWPWKGERGQNVRPWAHRQRNERSRPTPLQREKRRV